MKAFTFLLPLLSLSLSSLTTSQVTAASTNRSSSLPAVAVYSELGVSKSTGATATSATTTVCSSTALPAGGPRRLSVTALTGANGLTVAECWGLTSFQTSTNPGTLGLELLSLDVAGYSNLTVFPRGFCTAPHPTPEVGYRVVLSGLAHVTIPNSTQEFWVRGGKYGIWIAADTAEVSCTGHIQTYFDETVSISIPTRNGTIPPHVVLHDGPCDQSDNAGY